VVASKAIEAPVLSFGFEKQEEATVGRLLGTQPLLDGWVGSGPGMIAHLPPKPVMNASAYRLHAIPDCRLPSTFLPPLHTPSPSGLLSSIESRPKGSDAYECILVGDSMCRWLDYDRTERLAILATFFTPCRGFLHLVLLLRAGAIMEVQSLLPSTGIRRYWVTSNGGGCRRWVTGRRIWCSGPRVLGAERALTLVVHRKTTRALTGETGDKIDGKEL